MRLVAVPDVISLDGAVRRGEIPHARTVDAALSLAVMPRTSYLLTIPHARTVGAALSLAVTPGTTYLLTIGGGST